ncbi:ligand-binding sensor domain-containing protein [Altibacter sp. HG106]|uniref:ligand-binding sensor domain-containing protein n=1 Tax=Altibacter sp. HG106 TaxID=3023937 RepID=UPI002350482D|nr:two-component regulator propeller domain-containing protein [Altibacter sp. HG106]MDC7995664.1 two-component regulator propeller domain-containing protein [Altibacter sp. HG106]
MIFKTSKQFLLLLFLGTFLLLVCACKEIVHESNTSTLSNHTKLLTTPKLPNIDGSFYNGIMDNQNQLWFATRGNGIFRVNGAQLTNYTTENGLSSNHTNSIYEDSNGTLWVGTNKGVDVFDGTQFKHLKVPFTDTTSVWLDAVYPVVNPNEVMSVIEDNEGAIWLGTNGAGVYRYDGSSFTQHLAKVGMVYDDGKHHNIVLTMDKDSAGTLWFSSLSHGGVSSYDGERFTHYVSALSDDFIRVVYVDSKDIVWVGTHGNHKGGLDRIDASGITSFWKKEDGFRHNNVSQIFEDSKGRLWMASGTTPLSLFKDGHFKRFTSEANTTFPSIHFILEDSDHNIWFGGNNGLWRFDGTQTVSMVQE